MSDDDDKIISLLEERQRRLTSKDNITDEIKEELPPWFMMDDDNDNEYFTPISDNPFLLMSESIAYVEATERKIKRLSALNATLHKSMLTMMGVVLLFTLLNFIMVKVLNN